MTRRDSGSQPAGLGGLINRLNDRLRPYIGPPPLGPYDDVPTAASVPTCPICRAPIADHEIDRSGPRTMMNCPR